MSPGLEAARRVLTSGGAWLVGGALRDRLLDRPTDDVDLAVAGDSREAARAIAGAAEGAAFPLSESFGTWRVLGPRREWHVDLTPLQGQTIEDDLSQRDFTVNALAEALEGGEPIDPFGGMADLRAERLRMVSDQAFAADPLRVVRLARLGCELGFEPEPETLSTARSHATAIPSAAPERVFAELRRIVTSGRALHGLDLLDSAGALEVVLPELTQLRGIDQSHFHHLDVYDHTLAVLRALIDLEDDLPSVFGDDAPEVAAVLAEPLSDELTRGQALRFGALLHDVAKPQTRDITGTGRVTFIGHDLAGADLARATLARLRASERLRAHVAAVTRHHLRLGFLVHERPLSRRAVYRYLRACAPVEVDVTVLSVADRLATRGENAGVAIAAHLELARELMAEALRRRAAGTASPLVRGDELARELDMDEGPELGRLLEELEEARFAGEVGTRAEAIDHARSLLARRP